MSRYPSQDSIGAHSHRTSHSSSLSNPYEQNGSVGMYHNISQVSFHMSSGRSDDTDRSTSPDNSALYTPTQPMDLQAFESFSFPAGEDISASSSLFHRSSEVSCAAEQSFGLYTSAADDTFESPLTVGHLPLAQDGVYNTGLIMDSPILWENGPNILDSQRSSPVLDEWALPTPQLITSTSSSPLDYSPSLGGVSPTCIPEPTDAKELPPYPSGNKPSRKPVGPRQSKVASDMASRNRAPTGTSEASDESMRFVARSSLEMDNSARDHPLYHNAAPKEDGLYHCPWENDPSCQHKPEKLKCNYEYELSPPLPPYRMLTATPLPANLWTPILSLIDAKSFRAKLPAFPRRHAFFVTSVKLMLCMDMATNLTNVHMRVATAVLLVMAFHVTGTSVTICGECTMILDQQRAVPVDPLPPLIHQREAGISAKQKLVKPQPLRKQ